MSESKLKQERGEHFLKSLPEVPDGVIPPENIHLDWQKVIERARQAAVFTATGDISSANDMYQHIAIGVMHAIYGEGAVMRLLQYAMDQEANKAKIYVP